MKSHLSVLGIVFTFTSLVFAHSGGVDSNGCHRDRANKQHCHSERARLPSSARADPSHPPQPGDEGIFDGPLLWVTDGDSLRVMIRGLDTEIRLTDIDAPERDQPHGWEAKLQLIDVVRGKHLIVVPRDVDSYGRIVARVWADGVDVNRELVARGTAWFYTQYADDESLYAVEQQARDAKRGLWALPEKDREEPWVWRRKRAEIKASKF